MDYGDEQHIKREKAKAREMRQGRWWKNLIVKTKCYYCERAITLQEVTMDHIVPLSRGGRSTPGNIVPCCKPCNNEKKYMTAAEWLLR